MVSGPKRRARSYYPQLKGLRTRVVQSEGQVLFAAGIVWAPREHSSMAASPDLRCPALEVSDPPVSSPSRGGQCLELSLTVESGPGSMRACEPWPLLLLLLCSPVRRRVPTHPSRLQSRNHPRPRVARMRP